MQTIFSKEPPLYAKPRVSTPERPPPVLSSGPPPRPPPPLSRSSPSRDIGNVSSPPTPTILYAPQQRTVSVHSTSPPPRAVSSNMPNNDPRMQRWSVPLPSPGPLASPPPPLSMVVAPPPPPPPPPLLQPVTQAPIRDLLDEDDIEPTPGPSNSHSSAAPPRPPNPELVRLHSQIHQKFTSEYTNLSAVLAQDGERLRATQADLLSGEPAIRDEMARLEAVRDVCLTVAMRTRSFVEAAEANVAEMKHKGEPEVDELVCSTTIVYNQWVVPSDRDCILALTMST